MPSFSPIISEVINRLTFQCGTGRVIGGAKFAPYPYEETEGPKDLPSIRLFIPDFEETHRPRDLAKTGLTLNLTVSTARKAGVAALIEWVEKTMDAIDLKNDGTIDPLLNGTLRHPWSYKTIPGMVHVTSITAQITLTFVPRKTPLRGKRRL